jgi:hypothetical protein
MAAAVFRISPFHVGWRVQAEVAGRPGQETVTGERERAIQIAQYQAKKYDPSTLIVLRHDGTVDEEFSLSD